MITIKQNTEPEPETAPRYRVVIADPPWQFRRGERRACANNQYDVMGIADIRALPVRRIVADDSVLYLWIPNSQFLDGLTVMSAWGFNFKTLIPWIKIQGKISQSYDPEAETLAPQWGLGYWFRGCSELIAVGTRGKPKAPKNPYAGILSENFGHSRKPENIHQIAAGLEGPRLELFARRADFDGFDYFGNQCEGEKGRILPANFWGLYE